MPSAAGSSKAERRDSLVRRLTRWNLLVLTLALLLIRSSSFARARGAAASAEGHAALA